MRLSILLLRIFGYTWVALALLMVVAGLHPFNLTNYLITLVTFAPALAAFVIAGWLQRKLGDKKVE
jgi:hypothetical protein